MNFAKYFHEKGYCFLLEERFISDKLHVSLEEARKIQKNYFQEYNTTLNGMIKNHKIDANEFLEYVHDINIDFLKKDLELSKELEALDGKKIIFTNGSRKHALNVTQRIGIDQHFDDVFDIVDSEFIPKPAMEPYKKLIKKHKIDPNLCVFVEDIARSFFFPLNNLFTALCSISSPSGVDVPWALI